MLCSASAHAEVTYALKGCEPKNERDGSQNEEEARETGRRSAVRSESSEIKHVHSHTNTQSHNLKKNTHNHTSIHL